MWAEEGDQRRVAEDGGPDEGDEEEAAGLGEPASSCVGGERLFALLVSVSPGAERCKNWEGRVERLVVRE